MRISDWSSDVCSSDLHHRIMPVIPEECRHLENVELRAGEAQVYPRNDRRDEERDDDPDRNAEREDGAPFRRHDALPGHSRSRSSGTCRRPRSEEHTSALPSLMRILSAFFFLKK